MYAEHKRDMNHNYLVLHGEEEIDTTSYQVRMLVGNVIPSLVKCRIQGVNGNFAVYYDITSRQPLTSFYENKKLVQEDLKLIFGEFIRVMEDTAEYLMNPEQLVLMPEYMFLEVEKKEIYFCLLPGYKKELREQFQALTEYILPKIDHEDEAAVRIGYGIYRRALEDSFHLEHLKEELFRSSLGENSGKHYGCPEEKEGGEEGYKEQTKEFSVSGTEEGEPDDGLLWSRKDNSEKNIRQGKESGRNKKDRENKGRKGERKKGKELLKKMAGFFSGITVLAFLAGAKALGWLPKIETSVILGTVIAGMGTGMLVYTAAKKVRKKKEEEQELDSQRRMRRERAREERELFKSMENRDWELERVAEAVWQEKDTGEKEDFLREKGKNIGFMESEQLWPGKIQAEASVKNCGETVVLSMNTTDGPPSLVSREPGELATIYLEKELTVIGKLETASDAVIDLPTVSRVHAKIKKKEGFCYLTDLNSRNGTTVNGRLLKAEEEYCLQNEDEVDFAQARYVFLE